ncbi:hypothetical protein IQ06DRAFT_375714 [Phaeosphaeriaceae sp. SRC1lsM3a]|nr:hypothetical protein IQ06DRAFT_375714 [Stagonospora sp. SRC1lsM3a]
MAGSQQNQCDLQNTEVSNFRSNETVMETSDEDMACRALFEEELPPTTRTTCAIEELQNAFGTLLLNRRNRNPISDQASSLGICSDHSANKASETIVPHWTGSFDLFAFPRELRDRIYYHYLYRPSLVYRRNTDRRFPFEDHPEEVASLFLTCRQVYDEAFLVFCRYNLVEFRFGARIQHNRICNKGLAGVIRLFPDKPARHLQHLGVSSERYMYFTYRRFGDQHLTIPTDAFAQMLRDAYAFKDVFPKLRDFTVSFCKYDHFFGYSSMFEVEGQDEEEKITNCAELMSTWLGTDTVLPPRWFRFRFDEHWMFKFLVAQEDIWNKAYARLARERADKIEPVDESGKVWIEKKWGVDG